MARIVHDIATLWRHILERRELARQLAMMDDHMRSDVGLPPRGIRIVPNWRLHPYY